jgi:hypothetical protein
LWKGLFYFVDNKKAPLRVLFIYTSSSGVLKDSFTVISPFSAETKIPSSFLSALSTISSQTLSSISLRMTLTRSRAPPLFP